MLFILTIILLIIGFISFRSYDEDVGIGFYIFSAIFFVTTLIVLACYNETKSTCDKRIAVLEERNEVVLKQVEPIVNRYLLYESETLEKVKVNSENIIALSMYQIDIVVKNQDEITKIKLSKAELNMFKLWIFMGE